MATLNGATISTERLDKTPRFHRNPPEKKSREKRGTLQQQAGKERHDSDDHQQFNKREAQPSSYRICSATSDFESLHNSPCYTSLGVNAENHNYPSL